MDATISSSRSSSIYSQTTDLEPGVSTSSSGSEVFAPFEEYEVLAPKTFIPPPGEPGTARVHYSANDCPPPARSVNESTGDATAASENKLRSISLDEAYWKMRRSSNILLPEEMRANVAKQRASKQSTIATDATRSTHTYSTEHQSTISSDLACRKSARPTSKSSGASALHALERTEDCTLQHALDSTDQGLFGWITSEPKSPAEQLAQMYLDLLEDQNPYDSSRHSLPFVESPTTSDLLPKPLFYKSHQNVEQRVDSAPSTPVRVASGPRRADLHPHSSPAARRGQSQGSALDHATDADLYTEEWFDSSPSKSYHEPPSTPEFPNSPTSTYTTDPEEPTTPLLGRFASPPPTVVSPDSPGLESSPASRLRFSNATTLSAIKDMFSGSGRAGVVKEKGSLHDLRGKLTDLAKLADKASPTAFFNLAEKRRQHAKEKKRQELKRSIRLVQNHEL